MTEVKLFRTCVNCKHDNAKKSVKCNKCAADISKNESYHRRWLCTECKTINMAENEICKCGYKLNLGEPPVVVIVFIVSLFLAAGATRYILPGELDFVRVVVYFAMMLVIMGVLMSLIGKLGLAETDHY